MFSAVKPLINRKIFFDDYQIIFSCEKTTMKISGPVNELFSQVVNSPH